MQRIIKDLSAIEFDKAFIVMAKYIDIGWGCVKICETAREAAEKMKDLRREFDESKLIMREVKLTTNEDRTFEELKDRFWFQDAGEEE